MASMHDSEAVLAARVQGPAMGARRRISSRGPGRAIVRASLPGLLDTRLVRAELVRLRGPRPATTVDWGRANSAPTRTGFDARRAS